MFLQQQFTTLSRFGAPGIPDVELVAAVASVARETASAGRPSTGACHSWRDQKSGIDPSDSSAKSPLMSGEGTTFALTE